MSPLTLEACFTPDERLELFWRVVEPCLQREIRHKEIAHGDGGIRLI